MILPLLMHWTQKILDSVYTVCLSAFIVCGAFGDRISLFVSFPTATGSLLFRFSELYSSFCLGFVACRDGRQLVASTFKPYTAPHSGLSRMENPILS